MGPFGLGSLLKVSRAVRFARSFFLACVAYSRAAAVRLSCSCGWLKLLRYGSAGLGHNVTAQFYCGYPHLFLRLHVRILFLRPFRIYFCGCPHMASCGCRPKSPYTAFRICWAPGCGYPPFDASAAHIRIEVCGYIPHLFQAGLPVFIAATRKCFVAAVVARSLRFSAISLARVDLRL